VVLPAVLVAVTGDRAAPWRVTAGAAAALTTAFATDSSAAALPVTLRVVQERCVVCACGCLSVSLITATPHLTRGVSAFTPPSPSPLSSALH